MPQNPLITSVLSTIISGLGGVEYRKRKIGYVSSSAKYTGKFSLVAVSFCRDEMKSIVSFIELNYIHNRMTRFPEFID